MKSNHLSFQIALCLSVLGFPLLLLRTVPPAKAQNLSDVTGPIMTTSDPVGFGGLRGRARTAFRTSRIQGAVNQAAVSLVSQLQAGSLIVTRGNSSNSIPQGIQQALANVLTRTGDVASSASQLVSGLTNPTPASNKANPKAPGNLAQGPNRTALAQQLVSSLTGLIINGKVDPTKLRASVAAYNAFVNASSGDYLTNPPQEFIAIQAVLSALLNAATNAA